MLSKSGGLAPVVIGGPCAALERNGGDLERARLEVMILGCETSEERCARAGEEMAKNEGFVSGRFGGISCYGPEQSLELGAWACARREGDGMRVQLESIAWGLLVVMTTLYRFSSGRRAVKNGASATHRWAHRSMLSLHCLLSLKGSRWLTGFLCNF